MNMSAGGARSMLAIRKELIEPKITVLHLSGRISVGRPCQEIEETIQGLIEEKRFWVILDLAEVQRVDSTGFGTIVLCGGKLKKAGGKLRVAAANDMVEEIAVSSQIRKIVMFDKTVAEAVAALKGAATE
jgi:anti-sigma B factor antagonist